MIPFHFESDPAAAPDTRAIVIPEGIEERDELFVFLARAIPLPKYFGHNWDALDECLAEISEDEESKIALIHHDVPLEEAPSDQLIYLEILADAARNSKSLSVHFPLKYREHVDSILE